MSDYYKHIWHINVDLMKSMFSTWLKFNIFLNLDKINYLILQIILSYLILQIR